MDSTERPPDAAALAAEAFNQTIEILQWAGRSADVPTRRNTLIAWATVAGSSGLNQQALATVVEGLVNAALHEFADDQINREVIEYAARQIGHLPAAVIDAAYANALARAEGGSIKARRAALLSQLLAVRRRGFKSQWQAYAAALKLSIRTAVATLRDGYLSLAVASLVLTLLIALGIRQAGELLPVSVRWQDALQIVLLVIAILSASVAAAAAVPRVLTPGKWQLVAEAVVNASIVSTALFLLHWLNIGRFATIGLWPGLTATMAGLAVGRLATGLLPSSPTSWLSIATSLAAGGGWGIAAMGLAAASAAVWFGNVQSLPAMLVQGAIAVLAGLAGNGWRDGAGHHDRLWSNQITGQPSVAAARMEPNLFRRRDHRVAFRASGGNGTYSEGGEPIASSATWRSLSIATVGWLLPATLVACSFVVTWNEVQKEMTAFYAERPIDRVTLGPVTKIDCAAPGTPTPMEHVQVGTYYPILHCRGTSTIRLDAPELKSDSKLDFEMVDEGLNELDRDSLPNSRNNSGVFDFPASAHDL